MLLIHFVDDIKAVCTFSSRQNAITELRRKSTLRGLIFIKRKVVTLDEIEIAHFWPTLFLFFVKFYNSM